MQVKTADPDEVETLVGWAADEGWNPGIHDAATFHSIDPEGFFVAVDGTGLVGGICAVRWDATFGFVGLYIVRPDRRGHGVGSAVWRAATGRLQGGGTVLGLDGVVEQQPTYESLGFRTAHRNLRFEGAAGAWRVRAAATRRTIDPLEAAALDHRANPATRARYLRAWLGQPGAVTATLDDGSALAGFALARPCGRGWKLGPVVAPDPHGARALIGACLAGLDDRETVVLDVPEPNAAGVRLAEQHGMEVRFETARMYDGSLPHEPDLSIAFGVTTFELG